VLASLFGVGSIVLLASFGQIGGAQSSVARAQTEPPVAVATLRTAAGDEIGEASFTERDGRVELAVTARNLQAGFHGFHVHAVGACDGPDFTSAGPHFNGPDGQSMMMRVGHAGDLPSLLVNDDGTAQQMTVTNRFTVADLLSGVGTALIIHAGPDNFGNIPARYAPAPDETTLATGDAGARVACGVIQAADLAANGGQAR
jgi:Cu-Zn family superoxide dismutase